jgi:hypothetical protein
MSRVIHWAIQNPELATAAFLIIGRVIVWLGVRDLVREEPQEREIPWI